MIKRKWFGMVMAGVAAMAVMTGAPEASACGGAWFPEVEVDHRPMGIAMAEKLLDQGETVAAAATVVRVMPHVEQLDAKKSAIVARAQRVLAVAIARNAGKLDVGNAVPYYARSHWAGKTEQDRAANQTFAVNTLRTISTIKKDDPAVQTQLAEALAGVPQHKAEARAMLEKLAKKDLIATPEGYALLAKLRADAGDAKGQKVALERCRAMAAGRASCGGTAQG